MSSDTSSGSGTYTFTKDSTILDRDAVINKLIDDYDITKGTQSEEAKAKAKRKSTASVSFAFISAAILLGGILLITFLELEVYKLSWYSVVTVIVMYGILLAFNVLTFISIRTTEELNMPRLTIETTKMFPIVIVVFALLFAVPQLILVFENTVGYWWLSVAKRSSLTDTMNTLKSNLFQKPEFNGLVIPFNWLITTFNVDNFEDTINQIPKGPFVSEKSGVSEKSDFIDFYLPKEADFEVFKNNLKKLIEIKRKVGHFAWIYMAMITASLFATLETIK
jgi:hypothetical protein